MVMNCTVNMLIGGVMAIYIRFLYKRYSSSLGDRESFANVFPMLTLTTVVIIYVVKSSLALSLGLVGALSIVRFRTAIKTPEELAYLFLCIGIGLALGAEHRLLALVALMIVSAFIVGRRFLSRRTHKHNLLLTVTGEAHDFFQGSESRIVDVLTGLTRELDIQRLDIDDGKVQLRAHVSVDGAEDTTHLMAQLKEKLPEFRVSYVNLDTLL
jgi:uncharacterized membrane protein YhiD involved in acid resistance